MIISSGVMGICVLLGGLRHGEQTFRIEGAGPALAALVTLTTLVLVMPVFTTSEPGASYTRVAARLRRRSVRCWSGARSSSCRPSGTATTSCRPGCVRMSPCMPRHRPIARPGISFGCCWWRSWSWSGWPRCSPPRSKPPWRRRARRSPWSASSSRWSCCCRGRVGRARGARQPAADQHEPGLRLGTRQHWPDHPRRGAGFDAGSTCRWCWAWRPRTSCCWR